MSNYSQLKTAINAVITANGQNEITGTILNQILTAMVNSLGAGYHCMGVATPSTNPNSPDQNIFYFATEGGTYSNFGGIILEDGISVLLWNGSWTSQTWFTIDSNPTSGSSNLVMSGGVFAMINKLDLVDVAGTSLKATQKTLNLRYNEGTEEEPNYIVLSQLVLGQATDEEAGLLPAKSEWDDEPTPGGDKLVKSGGIASHIVYDISEANSGATYADLAAALGTGGANVPESIRKGGMSIKFVQSSDNKYVQYLLSKKEWSTEEGNWQKIVGLNEVVHLINGRTLIYPSESQNCLIASDGTIISTIFTTYFYEVSEGDNLEINCIEPFGSGGYCLVSSWNNDTFVSNLLPTPTSESKQLTLIIPEGVNKIAVSLQNEVYKLKKADELLPIETQSYLVKSDGTTESSQVFQTYFYEVYEGEKLEINCIAAFGSGGYCQVSSWNDNTFVSNLLPTPTSGNITFTYIIPQGVNRIAVSLDNEVFKLKSDSYPNQSIKCLFIGNSVCQDHVAYLPWLLKNTYPKLDFEIFLAYKGGWTIKGYVQDIITGNINLDIFSIARNTESWTNYSGVSFDSMFTYAEYDLIVFEGYFNHNPTQPLYGVTYPNEDSAYFKPFVDYIRTKQQKPFKLGYLLHQTYDNPNGGDGEGYTEAEVWAEIMQGMKDAILTTPVDTIFPCGAVSKILESDFGKSFLTPDNVHNNQGLPCIMGAYTLMKKISEYLGLKDMVINNELRIDATKETELNIPGPNGTLKVGTEEQYKKAQTAAVDAIKYADAVFNDDCLDIL